MAKLPIYLHSHPRVTSGGARKLSWRVQLCHRPTTPKMSNLFFMGPLIQLAACTTFPVTCCPGTPGAKVVISSPNVDAVFAQ